MHVKAAKLHDAGDVMMVLAAAERREKGESSRGHLLALS